MPHKPRNPKKKKNKTAAQKQNTSHGSVGGTSLRLGSQAPERAPPVEGDVVRELTAEEVCEIADMLEVQVVSARILEKLQAADSRRSDDPLPERLQPVVSSLREKAVAYLSQILHMLEDDDGESSESSENLAPEPMPQRDQTTPIEEDPPHPGQVSLNFHIYASALLPEPYVAQGWHYVPVLQHGAPPPAGGKQSVPVQEHVVPTPAGGYKSVLVHQHRNAIHHMPMPHVLSTYRPGYLQHNQLTETSAPPHGNEERQQDSQANNPSQNNSLQCGVSENNFGSHQCTLGTQTGEAQGEESAAH